MPPKLDFNVLLTNVVKQNGGDKAIYEAILACLEQNGITPTTLLVEDINPKVALKYYPKEPVSGYVFPYGRMHPNRYVNFALGKLMRVWFAFVVMLAVMGLKPLVEKIAPRVTREGIVRLRKVDTVLSMGGTYLIEKYGYIERMLAFILALAYGKKVVLMTQSMGPFTSPVGKMLIRYAFPKFTLVLLRDEKSLKHLEMIGVKTRNCKVLPDIVFAMAETDQWSTRKYPKALKKVAISVRNCAIFHDDGNEGQDTYEKNVAALVEELVSKHGAEVSFVSTCQGMKEYHYNDSVTAKSIEKRLSAQARKHTRVDERFMSPSEFQAHMKDFDLLISTRMHGAIQGLNAGTPVLPIAYEFKTVELWKGMGLSEYLIPLEESDPQAWVKVLNRAIETYPEYRKALATQMGIIQPKAMQAGAYVAEALGLKKTLKQAA